MKPKYMYSDSESTQATKPYRLPGIQPTVTLYRRVGTLGDVSPGLTCSAFTLDLWGKAIEILEYPTFELAAKDLLSGALDGLWVPAAYTKINGFILGGKFKVSDIAILPIPDLVLAGLTSSPPNSVDAIFFHPATRPLFSEIEDIEIACHQKSDSNPKAAMELVEHGERAIAITNTLSARHFDLWVYKTLRHDVSMPFFLFTAIK